MMRAVAIVAVLLTIVAVIPAGVRAQDNYILPFASRSVDLVPATVFGEWLIGFRHTEIGTLIIAHNTLTGAEKAIGIMESLSGNASVTPTFRRSGDWLLMITSTAAVVWNSTVDMVGRLVTDGLVSGKVMRDGTLVVWTKDKVFVAFPPGYTMPKIYDVGDWVENITAEVDWREVASLSGSDPDGVLSELSKQAKSEVPEGANTSTAVLVSVIRPIEFQVVDAGYSNGLYVAGNVKYDYNVTVAISWAKGNESGVSAATAILTVDYGMLIKEGALKELYSTILASADADTLAYAYLVPDEDNPVLAFIGEDGYFHKYTVYAFRSVKSVYLFGSTAVATSDIGFAVLEHDELVALIPGEVVFVGYANNKIYALFSAPGAMVEVGTYDVITGTAGKMLLQVDGVPLGAYVTPYVVIVATLSGSKAELLAYALGGLTTFNVTFVSRAGVRAMLVNGTYTIRYEGFTATSPIMTNPVTVTAPVGSTVEITVEAPFATGSATLHASAPGTYSVTIPLTGAVIPGSPGFVESAPFINTFFRDHAVVDEASIAHFVLPPAYDMDAYGSLIALTSQPATGVGTEVSVYTITGEFRWSARVAEGGAKVRFMWPYLVVYAPNSIRVFSAVTGTALVSDVGHHDGWDIDRLHGYLTVWDGGIIRVYDIRRGTRTSVSLNSDVSVAVPVAGQLLAFVQDGNVMRSYVINPDTGSVAEVYTIAGIFEGSASDGVFHAVSVLSQEGHYTLLISEDNGVVTIPAGPVLWVKDLGQVVTLPLSTPLLGARFAALVTRDDGMMSVWVAGITAEKILDLQACQGEPAFTESYIAVAREEGNRTSVVLLDWSGTERVVLLPSTPVQVLRATPQFLAYGGPEGTVVVPSPRTLGKYSIEITVQNTKGELLTATIQLIGYGARFTIAGSGKIYLSFPGNVTLRAVAPGYLPETLTVSVNDTSPTAVASFSLEPERYTLTVKVITPENMPAINGTIVVTDADTGVEVTRTNVVNGLATVKLPPGKYTVEFNSELYERGTATVDLTGNRSLTITVRQIRVPFTVTVIDENGNPMPGVAVATIVGATANTGYTDTLGHVTFILPVGVPVNITATKPHYVTNTTTVEPSPQNTSIVIKLQRFIGALIVNVEDTEGNAVEAIVTITNASNGVVIKTETISGSATYNLPEGIYNVTAETTDGRRASQTVSITQDTPLQTVKLVLPPPPVPIYLVYFPYMVIAVAVATFAIVLLRKIRRK